MMLEGLELRTLFSALIADTIDGPLYIPGSPTSGSGSGSSSTFTSSIYRTSSAAPSSEKGIDFSIFYPSVAVSGSGSYSFTTAVDGYRTLKANSGDPAPDWMAFPTGMKFGSLPDEFTTSMHSDQSGVTAYPWDYGQGYTYRIHYCATCQSSGTIYGSGGVVLQSDDSGALTFAAQSAFSSSDFFSRTYSSQASSTGVGDELQPGMTLDGLPHLEHVWIQPIANANMPAAQVFALVWNANKIEFAFAPYDHNYHQGIQYVADSPKFEMESSSKGSSLTHSTGDHTMTWTTPDGTQYVFNDYADFGGTDSANAGQLKSISKSDGRSIGFTRDAYGGVVATGSYSLNGSTITERFSKVMSSGKVGGLTFERDTGSGYQTLRTVSYTYDSNGRLKTATVRDGGSTAAVVKSEYYRWYSSTGSGAYNGSLQMFLSTDSVARAKQELSVTDLSTVSDANLKPYADSYYEYDSSNRVTKSISLGSGCGCGGLGGGGQGQYSYTYTDTTNTSGWGSLNTWVTKTVELLPDKTPTDNSDNDKNIVYTNSRGQVVFKIAQDTSESTSLYTWTRYDADGNVIETADSSAISGFSESLPDLIGYNASTGAATYLKTSGVVTLTEYYTAATAPEAGLVGYEHATYVQNGTTSSSKVKTNETTYTDGGVIGDGIYYVATQTTYGGATGSVAEVTSYAYTWYTSGGSNTTAMKSRTTTLPKITSSQNGPDSTTSSFAFTEIYDSAGNLVWTKDADGYVDYYTYDTNTGANTSVVRDVDPTAISSPSVAGPTRGSGLPTATGLVDGTNVYDADGRVIKTTSASGVITYTVYDDSPFDSDGFRQTKTYTWDATTNRPIGPVMVTRDNPALGFRETLTYNWPTTAGTGWVASNAPTGIETLSDVTLQSLTRTYYNVGGKTTETRDYFHLPSGGYSTASSYGTSGTDYLATTYLYDGRANVMRVARPDGTLEWSVYDANNRLVSSWKGTNDASYTPTDPTGGGATGNNMVKVASYLYDADGNTIESRAYFGGGTSDYYKTRYQYDSRDRLIGQVGPDGVGTRYTLDNEGHQTRVETFANTTINTDGTLNYGASSNLRGKTETLYDDQGRAYRTTTYSVDPSTGTVGDSITQNTWYDRRGNAVKTASANGLFQKSKFDGVGRVVSSYVSYDDAESSWADALTVTGDTVVSQQDVIYVADRAVISSSLDRTAATGSTTGALSKSNARLSTSVSWYDAAGRVIASGSYGTDPDNRVFGSGGAPVDANSDGVPDIYAAGVPTSNSSSGQLFLILSKTAYDDAGRVLSTTDNKGHVTRYSYDLMGRKTAMIENYVDGVASETESDTDRTTQWLYDAWGRLSILRALNPQGSGNGVQLEDTQYFYASDVDRSWVSFAIYPDAFALVDFDLDASGKGVLDTNYNTYDFVTTTYDRLGRTTTSTDQRGVVHAYGYDSAGRVASDVVTSLGRSGENVDGAVRAIGYGYDDVGRQQTTSTFSNTAMTTIASQVKLTYDGWGNVIKSQQSHSGAVTSGTPAVQYAYDDGATSGVAKYVRLSKVTYPNAREVNYLYGGADAANTKLNRVYEIGSDTSDTDGTFDARYFYSGTGTILRELRANTTSKLDYDPSNNGTMAGFDRFGRVVGQTWYKNTGTSSSPTWAATDATAYTYDENSNRTNRVSSTDGSGLSDPYAYQQSYAYDGLDRLTGSADSQPNTGGTAWVGTNGQTWGGVDALGNWRTSGTDTNGDGIDDSTQTRTHNAANEITGVSGSGATWGTPTYDAAGNLTRLPPATGSSDAYQLATYDAWNHQVGVVGYTGSNVATHTTTNRFDGLGRRISGNAGAVYFNEGWQEIETRNSAGTPTEQTIYSLRYIDAPLSRDVIGTSSTDRQWVQQDANFNVTSVADSAGAVLERYRYRPHGERSVYLASGAAKSDPTTTAYGNDIAFQGGRLDLYTSETLFRQREYSASLGRWLQRDPQGYVDSNNAYESRRSNPIHSRDPNGTDTKTDMAGSGQSGAKLGITDQEPKIGSNGRVEYPNNWLLKLPKDVSNTGWIIQEVSLHSEVFDCKSGARIPSLNESYHEAWRVLNGNFINRLYTSGSTRPVDYKDPNLDGSIAHYRSDTFNYGCEQGTKGFLDIQATAYYYPALHLPYEFIVKNPDTHAGDLPSTALPVSLPQNGLVGPVIRHFRIDWDRCGRSPKKPSVQHEVFQ